MTYFICSNRESTASAAQLHNKHNKLYKTCRTLICSHYSPKLFSSIRHPPRPQTHNNTCCHVSLNRNGIGCHGNDTCIHTIEHSAPSGFSRILCNENLAKAIVSGPNQVGDGSSHLGKNRIPLTARLKTDPKTTGICLKNAKS